MCASLEFSGHWGVLPNYPKSGIWGSLESNSISRDSRSFFQPSCLGILILVLAAGYYYSLIVC
jgi:hypothetical protein